VRDELASAGKRSALSDASLLRWLQQLGLAHAIPVQGEAFYVLEIDNTATTEADPLELLMAEKPSGVICYFSAIAAHSLTTQPVAHHHVAELQPPQATAPRRQTTEESPGEHQQAAQARGRRPRSLGSVLFPFQDVPFYLTRRSSRLVPGVQMRMHGPRTQLRITTREQALLDSLYKPHHCGGPAVVFEAWETASNVSGLDEEQLSQYLRAMDYPATTRRAGAMLELLGYKPGAELSRVFEAQREAIDPDSPYARISLLPGVPYSNLNERWLVTTP
jgi:hypothetical protein